MIPPNMKYITKDANGKFIAWELPPKKVYPLDRTEFPYWESKIGDFEILEHPFLMPDLLPKNCLLFIELLD